MIESDQTFFRSSAMAENYYFRSAINGFNRNDVIAYIDTILQEKNSASSIAVELESKLKSAEAKIDELTRALKQSETIKNDKCPDCKIQKVYEARLGAAMLDAKRFSEILVKEANDKASALFSDAFSCADQTSKTAGRIAQEIKAIKEKLNASLDGLVSDMLSLSSSLDSFKDNVEAIGGMFDFTTDFLPVKFDSNDVSNLDGQSYANDEKVSSSADENTGAENVDNYSKWSLDLDKKVFGDLPEKNESKGSDNNSDKF